MAVIRALPNAATRHHLEHRAQQRNALERIREANRAEGCAHCHARPQDPCVNDFGEPLTHMEHPARIAAGRHRWGPPRGQTRRPPVRRGSLLGRRRPNGLSAVSGGPHGTNQGQAVG